MKIYFLRSVKDKSFYIHPDGKHLFETVYALKKGKIGACCFTNEQAELFIVAHIEPLEKEELKK